MTSGSNEPQKPLSSRSLQRSFTAHAAPVGGIQRKVSKRLRNLSSRNVAAAVAAPIARAHTVAAAFLGRKESLRWLKASLSGARAEATRPESPGAVGVEVQTRTPSPTTLLSQADLAHAEAAYPGAIAGAAAPSRIRKRPQPLTPPERILALLLDRPYLDRESYLALRVVCRRLHAAASAPNRWPGILVDWWIESWLRGAEVEADDGGSLCDSLLDRVFETNLVALSDPDLPPFCLPGTLGRSRTVTESLRVLLPSDPNPTSVVPPWLPLGKLPQALLKGAPPCLIDQVAARLSRTIFARLLAREAAELYPDADPDMMDNSQQLAFLTKSLEHDRAMVLAFVSGYLPPDSLPKFAHLLRPEAAEWNPIATPLHVAAARGRRDAIKLLLSLGWHASGSLAVGLEERGSFEGCISVGLSPVEHALYAGHSGTARFLITHGGRACIEKRGESCPIGVAWCNMRRARKVPTDADTEPDEALKVPVRVETDYSPEEGEEAREAAEESFDALTLAHRGSKCLKLALDVLKDKGWTPTKERWREIGVELMFMPRGPAEIWSAAVRDIIL